MANIGCREPYLRVKVTNKKLCHASEKQKLMWNSSFFDLAFEIGFGSEVPKKENQPCAGVATHSWLRLIS